MSPTKLLKFGPLPIRIMAGRAFIVAGLPKFENLHQSRFFSSLGLPPDLLIPIALLEIIGEILLIVYTSSPCLKSAGASLFTSPICSTTPEKSILRNKEIYITKKK